MRVVSFGLIGVLFLVASSSCTSEPEPDEPTSGGGEAGATPSGGAGPAGTGGVPSAGVAGAAGETDSGGALGTARTPGTAGDAGASGAGAGAGMEGGIEAGGSSGGRPPTPTEGGARSTDLDDCELREKTESPEGCVLGYLCGDERIEAACQNFRGETECDCFGAVRYSDRVHIVSGVEGMGACEVMLDVCVNPKNPRFATPEVCTPDHQTSPADDCNKMWQSCERTFSTPDGASGKLTRERTLECFYRTAPFSCRCDDVGYLVDASTPSCGAIFDNCGFGHEYKGEIECEAPVTTVGEDSCETLIACLDPGDPHGYLWKPTTGRSARCSLSPEGDTRCRCMHFQTEPFVRTDLAPGNARTCERMVEACKDVDQLEFSGPLSCTTEQRSIIPGRCTSTALCTQQGSAGEEAVRGEGRFSIDCQQGDETWSCKCDVDGTSITVDVQTDDAEQACAGALSQCPSLLDVPIGVSREVGL